MADVSFGQYYPANSFAHKLDARFKLIFLIAYIVCIFLCKTFIGLSACAAALLVCVLFSRVPLGKIIKSIKGILFLLLFTAILNVFFYTPAEGETPLWSWQFIEVYEGGLRAAAFLIVRLFLLVMGSSLLTLTTTPVSLTFISATLAGSGTCSVLNFNSSREMTSPRLTRMISAAGFFTGSVKMEWGSA